VRFLPPLPFLCNHPQLQSPVPLPPSYSNAMTRAPQAKAFTMRKFGSVLKGFKARSAGESDHDLDEGPEMIIV